MTKETVQISLSLSLSLSLYLKERTGAAGMYDCLRWFARHPDPFLLSQICMSQLEGPSRRTSSPFTWTHILLCLCLCLSIYLSVSLHSPRYPQPPTPIKPPKTNPISPLLFSSSSSSSNSWSTQIQPPPFQGRRRRRTHCLLTHPPASESLTLKKTNQELLVLVLVVLLLSPNESAKENSFQERKGSCNSRNPETPRNPADRKSKTCRHYHDNKKKFARKINSITWHNIIT